MNIEHAEMRCNIYFIEAFVPGSLELQFPSNLSIKLQSTPGDRRHVRSSGKSLRGCRRGGELTRERDSTI